MDVDDEEVHFVAIHAYGRPHKHSISNIVWTLQHGREVESSALSKFQPETTLDDPQNVKEQFQNYQNFERFPTL